MWLDRARGTDPQGARNARRYRHALDGDADRVIIADERGRIVDGDQLLAVIAASFKEDAGSPSPESSPTVMSNLGLERYLEGLGLALARTPVGDRYVARTYARARI